MPGENDIVYLAYVDDKTLDFFERFDKNIERTAVAAEQGFDKVDGSIRGAGVEAGILGGIFASLTSQVVSFGLQAVSAVKNFIKESVELRARVDVLGTVLSTVAARMGKTQEEADAAEEAIKSMGITTQAARNSLLLMARANIDWSEAAKLARIAQDAAVVAGINSSDAFERLIRGIQKQEPELLDELGIQLRREDAYKKMAAQLNKTTKELTDAEKSQAILNSIYEQAITVAGSYEAALGNVGKQITSLPRYLEEVQLALGGAFQQSEQAKIQFYTESLKELQKWLDENQEQINRMATFLGTLSTKLYDFLGMVLDFAKKLPPGIEKAGLTLAQIINNIFDITDRDLTQNTDKWKTTFLQLISIIAGGFSGLVKGVTESIRILVDTTGVAVELLKGNVDGAQDALGSAIERAQNLGDTVYDAVYKGFEDTAVTLGLLTDKTEDAEQAAQDLADVPVEEPFEEATEEAERLKKAIDNVNDTLDDMLKRQVRAAEDMARADSRENIIDQVRNRFRTEDIERSYWNRIAQISRDAQREQARIAEQGAAAEVALNEQHSERLAQIEQSLQERLRDIRQQFDDTAQEAARRRDAVAILAAMRERDREERDAQQAHDEQVVRENNNFEEQQRRLDESIRAQQAALAASIVEQQAAANAARQEDYANMERDLERQRTLQTLYDQFEAEDRAIAFQRQLEDMGEQFAGIEGLTADGLAGVLEEWEQHFGDLSALMEAFNEEVRENVDETMTALTPYITGMSPDRIGEPQTGTTGDMGNAPPPTPNHYRWLDNFDRDRLLELAHHMGMGATPQAEQILQQYTAAELRSLILQAIQAGVQIPPGFVIGQGGQLSMGLASYGNMLANDLFSKVSQIPAVVPQSFGVDRRELYVTVDGTGLDPYMQRLLVNALVEVERNRGT